MSRMHVATAKPSAVSRALARDRLGVLAVLFFVLAAVGIAGKLAVVELTQLRKIGQREYLIIQPLAPATAEPLVSKAAEAVKVLDGLGLVVRLV